MTALDTNILVYAHVKALPQHRVARARLISMAEGDALWGIPVFCLGEFIRVVTHPRLFDAPYTVDTVCLALARVLESPSLRILSPGPRYWPLFAEALHEADAIGNLAFDAQIVAVCRETGVSALLTGDRDFDRFSDFRVERL